jgi:hypothetical protein
VKKKAIKDSSPKKIQSMEQPDFPLPQPIELAELAAILQPDSEPKAALKKAMEFYVEAVLFFRELPSTSEDALVREFGSHERDIARRAQPLKQLVHADWTDRLELNPKKHDDDARRFLTEQGLPCKTAKSVINHLRRHLQAIRSSDTYGVKTTFTWEQVMPRLIVAKDGRKTFQLTWDELLQRFEKCTLKDGEIFAIPRFMLKNMVPYWKWHRNEQKKRSWHTRKSRESSLEKTRKQKVKKSFV